MDAHTPPLCAQMIQSSAARLVAQLEGMARETGGKPVLVDVDQAALRVTLDVIGLVRTPAVPGWLGLQPIGWGVD